jgi:hypothetical protein
MNLNKYYGYVYVSATMSTQNMNYQRYLNQMNLPLYSKQKKIKPSHEKACNTIPMQRHLSFSVPTKHLSSWGDLFKSCFPLLFTTLVLNDSWTGGILNAQYLLLYCTPSKQLMDRAVIQSTLVLKKPYLVYLAKTTLLNLS